MSTKYFSQLTHLLAIEKEEDLRSYLSLSSNSSASERRTAGLTWYPIAIRNTETTRGDYLSIEVERTTHQDVGHQFRFGSSVALFSNHEPKSDRIEGTVTYQNNRTLKITFRVEELPEWCRNGKLGIDLLFDDNSYREMEAALSVAATLQENTEEGHLVRILTGERTPSFNDVTRHHANSHLNRSQEAAINRIISARELAVVHGPPGTGKTTTLIQAIKALYEIDRKQILVVAPSNAAVDLLTEKLAEEGLEVLRVGNPERVSEDLVSATLDSKMQHHSSMKQIKGLRKQAAEYKNMAHKYKRNYGRAEQDQRKALFNEAHKILKEVDKAERFIMDDLLARAQVITATLVGCNHYTVRNLKYGTVVVDEAGQALEPACWIPILKAEKLVLSGDHCQLPPTIKSEKAKGELSRTLLEKCSELHPESVVLLDEQYRMNTNIMTYSSRVFYQNKLKAHASVADQLLFANDHPVTFIDTAGAGFIEQSDGSSITNTEEASFLINHLMLLAQQLALNTGTREFPSVAIVSPYKQQVIMLRELLLTAEQLKPFANNITVDTIDSFQGQERDVVYISMTRSNAEGNIGFLSDIRRMNVAMTRARKKLVVIGDSSTLSRLPFYDQFIAYVNNLNAYQSSWDFQFDT